MTCVDREKFLTLEKLEAIFGELDVDGSHTISLEELSQFLGNSDHVDKEALAEAFANVDPKGKGEISFGQFKLLIRNLL